MCCLKLSTSCMRVSVGVTKPSFFSRGPHVGALIISVSRAIPPTNPNTFSASCRAACFTSGSCSSSVTCHTSDCSDRAKAIPTAPLKKYSVSLEVCKENPGKVRSESELAYLSPDQLMNMNSCQLEPIPILDMIGKKVNIKTKRMAVNNTKRRIK